MRLLGLVLGVALVGCAPHGKADAGAPVSDGGQPAEAEASAPDAGPVVDSLPPSQSDELTTRARHLLEAISKDDPSLATDIVFPRDAYVAAKDAADPGKQWDDKVSGAFQKQVHLLHKRTAGIERAQLTSFDLGLPIGQVVPKKHDMKVALWRVRHSRLNFTIDGKASRIDLAELMSWRGAWYVLGIK
jgi:hypothetical protein